MNGSEKIDSGRLELRQRYDLYHSCAAERLQGDYHMTTKALFVKLEAKPGKEDEVAKFLRDGQGLVQQEPATIAWFGHSPGPNQLRHLRRICG
jgi:hypothetical protein